MLDCAIVYIIFGTISVYLVSVTEIPQAHAVQTNRLIVFRDIIDVCYVSTAKYTKALWGQICN